MTTHWSEVGIALLAMACGAEVKPDEPREPQGQQACDRYVAAMEACTAQAWPQGDAPGQWGEDCTAIPDIGDLVGCYVLQFDCRRDLLEAADCTDREAASAALDAGLADCRDFCEG